MMDKVILFAATNTPAAAAPAVEGFAKNLTFTWFDILVLGVLVVGFIVGRKRGMSGELVDLLMALIMVVVPALFYKDLSKLCTEFLRLAMPWANLLAYCSMLFVIMIIFGVIKNKMGNKVVGADLFGRAEYIFGPLAGVARFACYLLILFSLIHSSKISKEEAIAAAKEQEKIYGSSFFPSRSQIQVDIVHDSMVGRFIKDKLEEQILMDVNYGGQATVKPDAPAWKAKDPTEAVK
jgi:uncharacterized membrane protein required for colicin V production